MSGIYEHLQNETESNGRGLVPRPADLPPLNLFEREASGVRNHTVNWQSYVQYVITIKPVLF